MAYAAGGNPRILLKTIQDLEKFNTSAVNSLVKEFYREKIWVEHTELGEKYSGHRLLIDWGRDFLEKTVVPTIEDYNKVRREKGVDESSIYFWIHKDSPAPVKEALRLLTYTGIITKLDTSIRATRSELGTRYEVKYGCIISLETSPHSESKGFHDSLSVKKHPEFGKQHSSYSSLISLDLSQGDDEQYRESLQTMLRKPIDVLGLLTPWQREKLKGAGIATIEELHLKTEESLIENIYQVGPHRARLMKNAATAELLEYLSG